MKFRIGDKVKILKKTAQGYEQSQDWIDGRYPKRIGYVVRVGKEKNFITVGDSRSDGGGNFFRESDLEVVNKRGRPSKPKPEFKVGDEITGLKGSKMYGITTENAIMEVVEVIDERDIRVKITEHKKNKSRIGETYNVNSKYFRKTDKETSVMFKVGDKVKVKKHPRGKCSSGHCAFMNDEMEKRIGEMVTISCVKSSKYYLTEENGWNWSDCMLQKINKNKPLVKFETMDGKRPVYWECINGSSKKFWAAHIIKRAHKFVLVRKWGRIGNEPQTVEQEFGSQYEAEEFLNKLIWAKEKKGYRPIF